MALRTLSQVIADAITFIQNKIPGLSTLSGTVARDVVIESPAQEFALVYEELNRTQLIQSLEFPDQFATDELDRVATDAGLVRSLGTASTVPVTFRLPTFAVDITIAAGTQVSTQTSPDNPTTISFLTSTTGVFSIANAPSYYNPLTGLYELTIVAQAIQTGTAGNVGAGTITVISSAIANAASLSIFNSLAATGGTNTEDNTSLADRIRAKLSGNNIGTSNGVLSLVRSNPAIIDLLLIRPGDAELLRDQYGNAFDVIIIGETLANVSDPYIFSPDKLDIQLNRQPARAVTSVTGFVSALPYTFIEGVDYTVTIDVFSMYMGTSKALSKITLLPSGTLPDIGSTITVIYSINNLIEDLQTTLETDDNKIIGSDPLIKEAIKVLINVGATIRTLPGYVHADVATAVVTNVTDLLNSVKLNVPVDQSDIITVVGNIPGVDEVDIPISLEAKRPSDPGFISVTNVVIKRTEYGRPNTIIIT